MVIISSDAARTVSVLEEAAQSANLRLAEYFLTDGSKDSSVLLSTSLTTQAQALVDDALGTAPASPTGTAFNVFRDDLLGQFNADAGQYSFVAHSYDAAYVGVYGIVFGASMASDFSGLEAAHGFSRLAEGTTDVPVGSSNFSTAVTELGQGRSINISGTSGPLDFDSTSGEAPGDIEVWGVDTSGSSDVFLIHTVVSADAL
jgi:branched-chain amino acid transport system substrate-binding protein